LRGCSWSSWWEGCSQPHVLQGLHRLRSPVSRDTSEDPPNRLERSRRPRATRTWWTLLAVCGATACRCPTPIIDLDTKVYQSPYRPKTRRPVPRIAHVGTSSSRLSAKNRRARVENLPPGSRHSLVMPSACGVTTLTCSTRTRRVRSTWGACLGSPMTSDVTRRSFGQPMPRVVACSQRGFTTRGRDREYLPRNLAPPFPDGPGASAGGFPRIRTLR
jgi:hypothetical protein